MGSTELEAWAKDGEIAKADFPDFKVPMLATLTKNFSTIPNGSTSANWTACAALSISGTEK